MSRESRARAALVFIRFVFFSFVWSAATQLPLSIAAAQAAAPRLASRHEERQLRCRTPYLYRLPHKHNRPMRRVFSLLLLLLLANAAFAQKDPVSRSWN